MGRPPRKSGKTARKKKPAKSLKHWRIFPLPIRLDWRGLLLLLLFAASCSCEPDQRVPVYNPASRRVPSRAFFYQLRYGETLDEIARRYGRSPQAIIVANNLKPPYMVYPGYRLLIPAKEVVVYPNPLPPPRNANPFPPLHPEKPIASPAPPRRTPPPPAPTARPAVEALETPARLPPDGSSKNHGKQLTIPASALQQTSRAGLRWPVAGILERGFSNKPNDVHPGIVILAPLGETVCAAAAGKVIGVGELIAGYGRMVIIKHEKGYSTTYANLKEIRVAKGENVTAGQAIATIGQTIAIPSAPHLHFEVLKDATPVDPISCLPGVN
ncbi:MAG: M23 family metallopeptidase [Candidatus Sumerlaeota bacterium]|nr:M23 family metallopeptidase [Candidatus Sumerlaeota bacterium]